MLSKKTSSHNSYFPILVKLSLRDFLTRQLKLLLQGNGKSFARLSIGEDERSQPVEAREKRRLLLGPGGSRVHRISSNGDDRRDFLGYENLGGLI